MNGAVQHHNHQGKVRVNLYRALSPPRRPRASAGAGHQSDRRPQERGISFGE